MNWINRICPTTGLRVDRQADRLIQANAVAATVALLVGGVAAVLVLLTRWQAIHLLDAVWFYRILTVHGMNMLIFFIIFFEMAVLDFAGPVLLNSRVAAPKIGWLAFVLMVVGTLLVEWTMWTGRADVLFTSYVPLKAHSFFYLGVILFAVGALSANVRETRSTQRIRVGRRQRKRTCWDCEREWKRMVVPLEPGRPSEARQLLRTQR